MIKGLTVNTYICHNRLAKVNYSRQLLTNQVTAWDRTHVLYHGVASPFFFPCNLCFLTKPQLRLGVWVGLSLTSLSCLVEMVFRWLVAIVETSRLDLN